MKNIKGDFMKDKSHFFKDANDKNFSNSGKIVLTKDDDNNNMLAISPARFLLPLKAIKESKEDRKFGITYTEKEEKDSNINFDIIFEMEDKGSNYDSKSVVVRNANLPHGSRSDDFKVNALEFIKSQAKLFLKYDRKSLLEDSETKDEFIDEYIKIMDKFFGEKL